MDLVLIKTPQGALIPASEEEAEKLRRIKSGATVRSKVTQMRNGRFFRKWFLLVKVGFDLWTEIMPPVEYRGQVIQPNFDKFRKDVTIMAGHFHPVFNVRGEMRLEADSIAWGEMSEDEFHTLYQKTITVLLEKVLTGSGMDEERLQAWVDRVMEFA